jgi:5-methylcytosine-specific restriction endonuclease McrA
VTPAGVPDPKPGKRKRSRPAGRIVNPRAGRAKIQDEGKCRICPSRIDLDRHHLVPRSLGGDDVDENLIPLCHTCHMEFEHGTRRGWFGHLIRRALTRSELAYVLRRKSEVFLERYYPEEAPS